MSISNILDGDLGNIWVQPNGFGTEPRRLLCADSDGFESPMGDITTRMCRKGFNRWQTVRRSKGIPGEVTATIETYLPTTMDWLQKQRERACAFNVFIVHSTCGDEFLDYEVGEVAEDAYITSVSGGASVRGKEDAGAGAADAVTKSYELSAQPLALEYWKLVLTEETTTDAEAEPARDVSTDKVQRCAGDCGDLQDAGQDGFLVCDSAAGPALSTPHETENGFVTTAAAAADPFAAGEDIASGVQFYVDKNTERFLVACGTAAAAGLRVAYTDDRGATWTVVAINASATEYAMWGGALFALDNHHIWLCTNEANVYFSSDGGVTWTDQSAPAPGASEGLYAIHFADANYGWAVGGFDVTPTLHMIQTTDGGAHWSIVATEPQVQVGTGVYVMDSKHVRISFLGGNNLYLTRDWGETYEEQALHSGGLDSAGDVDGFGYLGVAICGYWTDASADEYGVVFRSVDGGYSWERHVHSTTYDGAIEYAGMNALSMDRFNRVVAVGEIVDSAPAIMILENSQPA